MPNPMNSASDPLALGKQEGLGSFRMEFHKIAHCDKTLGLGHRRREQFERPSLHAQLDPPDLMHYEDELLNRGYEVFVGVFPNFNPL
jgi:hypothetical protein